MIPCNEVDDTVPLVEEGEQRFKLEDRDIVQMNDTGRLIFVLIGLSSKYTSEFGGVGKQEMFVYSEMSVPDLSNAG
jgi:hypothetical protein